MNKVINEFIDKDKTHYKVGDDYPKDDKKATKKHIADLLKVHPKYNRIFIEKVEVSPNEEKKTDK